ncbi:transposable element Tc1 transposase [Trichonephila clavipes]|nr:transposable element Tc1 transposase [Trichonephila clavipes]
MVRAGIMHNDRTPLHIFERGSVTSQCHCREIILDHVRIVRGAVGPDFLFMDDNAWPRRSIEVSDALQSENILHMQWPAYFPDLNPIEHAWDTPGRRVAQRTIPLHSVQELKTASREEWDNIPLGLFDSLMKSMENRCKMCISVHGQHTSY